MARLQLRGHWVLVTGASSGIGRDMARVLARDYGAHVLVSARRKERLVELKAELESSHGVCVETCVADLSDAEQTRRVLATAKERGVAAGVLNAGITYYGEALLQSEAEFEQMLATNVSSLVVLAQGLGRFFIDSGAPGGLLLVSSVASMAPVPYQSAYSGTKAFITTYGRSLATELRGTGASVTVFAPGGINTELIESSGLGRKFKADGFGMMPSETVAKLGVTALVRRRGLVVPGLLNQFLVVAAKLLPHAWLLPTVAALYRPPGKGEN